MARKWFGLGAGLFIITALLSSHVAPAKATRPLVHASGALEKLVLSTPRDLNQVTERRWTGLAIEDKRVRSKSMKQAKAYIAYRRSGSSAAQEAYLDACGQPNESDNPYCQVEAELASEKAAAQARRSSRSQERERARAVIEALEAGDLERLTGSAAPDLFRGVGRIDDFASLVPLARKVADAKGCSHAPLAQALAAKAEETFPEAQQVDIARRLYRRVADCGSEPARTSARFRFSMISIWQNKCGEADPDLMILSASPEASHFHARAKYWRHYCAGILGNETARTEMRESLWRDHTLTFHNLAINGRDPRIHALLQNQTQPKVAARSLIRPDLNSLLRGTEALVEAGADDLAMDFTDRYITRLTGAEPEVRLYAAALMHRSGNALPKFRILTSLFQDAPRLINRASLTLLFPSWYTEYLQPKAKLLDPLLVLSLIRQESAFNSRARSIAGARGLMQVMPATARHIASVRRDRLFDPRTNIEVGTKYFLHRLERYNGDVELTLAAYNAGFSRVDRWIKRYPLENKVLFMDLIPFRETRDYVSSILRNYFWYTQIYGAEPVKTSTASKVHAILNANAGAKAYIPAAISQ